MILGRPATFFRIVAGALFPPARPVEPPAPLPRRNEIALIQEHAAKIHAGLPHLAADQAGNIRALFLGAGFLAAPFLLFRLKRLGYSRSRVDVLKDGLEVTACR